MNLAAPHQAVEIDPEKGKIIWKSPAFEKDVTPVRDANRLPNGNTLITCATKIVEINAEGKTVWQMLLRGVVFNIPKDRPARGFYKAERNTAQR